MFRRKLSSPLHPPTVKQLTCFRREVVHTWRVLLLLGGSWDLVSTVISTLIGVISTYKGSYFNYNPSH